MRRVYVKLFTLLNNCVKLNRALIDRKTGDIEKYARGGDLIFMENIAYETAEMLEKLK